MNGTLTLNPCGLIANSFFTGIVFTKYNESVKLFLSLFFNFIFTIIFKNLLLYEEMLILPRSLKNLIEKFKNYQTNYMSLFYVI